MFGLRGSRTVFESFLPRLLGRSVKDGIVYSMKSGDMMTKQAFRRVR